MKKPVLDQVIAELIIGGEFSRASGALAWGGCLDRIQLRWQARDSVLDSTGEDFPRCNSCGLNQTILIAIYLQKSPLETNQSYRGENANSRSETLRTSGSTYTLEIDDCNYGSRRDDYEDASYYLARNKARKYKSSLGGSGPGQVRTGHLACAFEKQSG